MPFQWIVPTYYFSSFFQPKFGAFAGDNYAVEYFSNFHNGGSHLAGAEVAGNFRSRGLGISNKYTTKELIDALWNISVADKRNGGTGCLQWTPSGGIYIMKSQQEAFLAGYLYNFEHNSWQYTEGKSAYKSVQRFKIEIAEENFTKNMAADASGNLFSSNNYGPDFVRFFHGIAVFETDLLPGAGLALPGIGIFLRVGAVTKQTSEPNDLLRHEFGHIRQAIEWGEFFYYGKVAPTSLLAAQASNLYNDADCWTEWTANILSYKFLRYPDDWNKKRYPLEIKGYSPWNFPDFKFY